jgi:hypothetical protein
VIDMKRASPGYIPCPKCGMRISSDPTKSTKHRESCVLVIPPAELVKDIIKKKKSIAAYAEAINVSRQFVQRRLQYGVKILRKEDPQYAAEFIPTYWHQLTKGEPRKGGWNTEKKGETKSKYLKDTRRRCSCCGILLCHEIAQPVNNGKCSECNEDNISSWRMAEDLQEFAFTPY